MTCPLLYLFEKFKNSRFWLKRNKILERPKIRIFLNFLFNMCLEPIEFTHHILNNILQRLDLTDWFVINPIKISIGICFCTFHILQYWKHKISYRMYASQEYFSNSNANTKRKSIRFVWWYVLFACYKSNFTLISSKSLCLRAYPVRLKLSKSSFSPDKLHFLLGIYLFICSR